MTRQDLHDSNDVRRKMQQRVRDDIGQRARFFNRGMAIWSIGMTLYYELRPPDWMKRQ